MDTSRSSSSLYYRPSGITPKKSPSTENVQKRRKAIEKSEKAAYWALFNTSIALLLYCELCYFQAFDNTTIMFIEWTLCVIFAVSACYDYFIHFSPHFAKPVKVSSAESRLLGIRDDELGFEIEEPISPEIELIDDLPPFEIQFMEEERVVTPPKKK